MAYDTLSFRIIGAVPLVMRAGQLADPMNRFAREIRKISGKHRKTDADFAEIARLEFLGSLYLSQGEPCLPGEVVEACIVRGAMRQKRGREAKVGILCLGAFPLQYDGPRNPLELWEREEFRLTVGARVGKATVMRTRPIFRQWSAEIEVRHNPALLDGDEVMQFLAVAGELEGIGDWRPRFGRFEAGRL